MFRVFKFESVKHVTCKHVDILSKSFTLQVVFAFIKTSEEIVCTPL